MDIALRSKWIKKRAQELGFSSCGISTATYLEEQAPRLENWLNQNQHGTMSYMENHFDKRLDPRKLIDGAKSVISFSYNYFPEKQLDLPFNISKYAYGRDYHKVLKKKLLVLLKEAQQLFGDINGRAFVDSAPVMDKVWAEKSGIGWIGKNTNLITKKQGSFYFIGELILDIEFQPDAPTLDHCGSCTKCIDACPTDALTTPYQIDGSKCISYYTIELKDKIPTSEKGKLNNWAFGCDICQDVCPWNRHASAHNEPDFSPNPALSSLSKDDWLEITEDIFNQVFEGTPVKRAKLEGLKKNLDFLNER